MCVEYQCERCRSIQPVNDGPVAFYVLSDGRNFFGPHGVGWCPLCRLLTEVEEVPAAEVLAQQMEFVRQFPENEASQGLEEHWKTLVEWSRMRQQPPRCLRCGCRRLLPLKRSEESLLQVVGESVREFRHPACGGKFRVRKVLFAQPIGRSLSGEGELLEGRWDGVVQRWVRRLWSWVEGQIAERGAAPARPRM